MLSQKREKARLWVIQFLFFLIGGRPSYARKDFGGQVIKASFDTGFAGLKSQEFLLIGQDHQLIKNGIIVVIGRQVQCD